MNCFVIVIIEQTFKDSLLHHTQTPPAPQPQMPTKPEQLSLEKRLSPHVTPRVASHLLHQDSAVQHTELELGCKSVWEERVLGPAPPRSSGSVTRISGGQRCMFRRHRELPRSTTKGQGSSPAWISNHTPLGSCVDFPRSSAAPKKKTPRPLIVALAKASLQAG